MFRRAARRSVLVAILLVASPMTMAPIDVARAEERPTLSGSWSASSMREVWSTPSWGEACGPKPVGAGAPGGRVTVTQTGGELRIEGAGRPWSTTECWEQLPGLRRTSHSGGQRGWSTRCASAPGDPRRATIDTLTTATDETIVFQETGVFEFAVAGETCRATVGRSRSFKLLQRAGEAPPSSIAPSASAASSTAPAPSAAPSATAAASADRPPASTTACERPGEPVRLEVRPVQKLLRPGEAFAIVAVARDAAGCAARIEPTTRWLREPSAGLGAEGLRVSAAPEAIDGANELSVEAAGRSVTVRIEVVRPDRYAELVAERGLDASGEDGRVVVAELVGSLGGGATRAEDAARERKIAFVLVVGALALPLALAGYVLHRRSRRRVDRLAPPPSLRASVLPNVELFDSPGSRRAMVCGRCGRIYPPGTRGFCEDDGAPLRPAATHEAPPPPRADPAIETEAPAVAEVERTAARPPPDVVAPPPSRPAGGSARAASVCPECGKRYPEGSVFCGDDGARLQPMH